MIEMSQIFTREIKNAVVHNPEDHFVYVDNPKVETEKIQYTTPIMNAQRWMQSSEGSKTASTADPLAITEVFVNNGKESTNYADIAKDYFQNIIKARRNNDRSLAAAIITSKDYSLLQDTVVIAENAEFIDTGVLSGLFEEIGTTTLTGKYRDFAHDLKWFRNIPEGKSPEPSFGASSETTISVPKHGGAVAITDRARDVINGANIFSRLVGQLQQFRLKDENLMVAQEIESNTGNTETGVDFGDRSGSPPVSDQNPLPLIGEIINDFETASTPGQWDLFVTKAFIFNEYITNDIIRGTGIPAPTQVGSNLVTSGAPAFPAGVRWVRDNVVSSSTAGWALDSSAIKKFRGPTRQYTVTDPEKEYEKYTTKTHLQVETVKTGLVFNVTGIAA